MNDYILCFVLYAIGLTFQYTFINMGVWWLFHLCVFFYEVMFPFHANQFRKLGNTKKLAAVLITLGEYYSVKYYMLLNIHYDHIHLIFLSGFIIPLPATIVPIVSKDHRFSIVRFPPSICLADEGTWLFYSFTLPFSIAIAIGVCLLIIIIWMIHLKVLQRCTIVITHE